MLSRFFHKSLGDWVSYRSYYYALKKNVVNSVTNFTWKEENGIYAVEWNNSIQNSTGRIVCKIEDDFTIYRDSGYFTKNPTESKVVSCSSTFLKTVTVYNDTEFTESIEFISDTERVRRTIAKKLDSSTGEYSKLFLVGNYIEHKI